MIACVAFDYSSTIRIAALALATNEPSTETPARTPDTSGLPHLDDEASQSSARRAPVEVT
jgi:hypothetical protein